MSNRTPALPVSLEARERLREQQHREARQLELVLMAQRSLLAEQAKAARVVAKAEDGVAFRRAAVEDAQAALVAISGLARAAVLLDRREGELARVVRARSRQRADE